jgi:hypothetical protein
MKTLIMTLAFAAVAGAQQVRNSPPDLFDNGFIMLDVLKPFQYNSRANKPKIVSPLARPEAQSQVTALGLQQFRPNFKFLTQKPLDTQEPWVGRNLDVRNKTDAERLAKILQAYIFEGWFEGVDLNDLDSHFRNNDARTWCNTPWLNVTEKGREAIHGLTKEFPIRSTSVYAVPVEIEDKELAVTWGSSFFNSKTCAAYHDFFKEPNMIRQFRERKPLFDSPDGSVSFKLLFNTMPDWKKNMPQWRGAYNWHAHVTNVRKAEKPEQEIRRIMNIPLVQIDVALRDSRLRGTDAELKNWIMVSYYYDASYTNSELKGVPEALTHMRPIGLQYGLDAGESFIFEGSHNNHRPGYASGDKTEAPYENTRLNGPVDNTVSSCLGCHAQSGMNVGLPDGQSVGGKGMGFMSKAEFLKWSREVKGGGFDFNMQVDKGARNFAKGRQQKINGADPVK